MTPDAIEDRAIIESIEMQQARETSRYIKNDIGDDFAPWGGKFAESDRKISRNSAEAPATENTP